MSALTPVRVLDGETGRGHPWDYWPGVAMDAATMFAVWIFSKLAFQECGLCGVALGNTGKSVVLLYIGYLGPILQGTAYIEL